MPRFPSAKRKTLEFSLPLEGEKARHLFLRASPRVLLFPLAKGKGVLVTDITSYC